MKIKIGYLLYDIEFVDRMPEGYDEAHGLIEYTEKKIFILNNKNWSEEYRNYVIYHELAHGMLRQIGEKDSERKTDKFAHILYQTFGDYKKFLIEEEINEK